MMMALGDFRFRVNTAAYQTMKQTSSYNWTSQNRIGDAPLHQSTGKGTETIELEGIILPHYRGGFSQIRSMRSLASQMQPLTLVSGNGDVLGQWMIKQVEETQSIFNSSGMAQKMTFRLQLEQFDFF